MSYVVYISVLLILIGLVLLFMPQGKSEKPNEKQAAEPVDLSLEESAAADNPVPADAEENASVKTDKTETKSMPSESSFTEKAHTQLEEIQIYEVVPDSENDYEFTDMGLKERALELTAEAGLTLSESQNDISDSDESSSEKSYEDSERIHAVLFEEPVFLAIRLNQDSLGGLKRIGEGLVNITLNGISFFSVNRLYRFDFHRIEEMKTAYGVLEFRLAGETKGMLFLFNSEQDKAFLIESRYREFNKDA